MHVRPIEQSSFRFLRNSMRAYLEGKKNLAWIAGIIGARPDSIVRAVSAFNDIRTPILPTRQTELMTWIEEQLQATRRSPQETSGVESAKESR